MSWKSLIAGLCIFAGGVYLLVCCDSAPQSATQSIPAAQRNSNAEDTSNCTSDCSGHDAGYRWAEENSIDDVSACDTAGDTSNSPSFAEGCREYVVGNETSGEPEIDDQ